MPTTTLPSLSGLRMNVAASITSLPVYGVPPGDVAHLPAAVVGAPALTRLPALGGVWEVEFEVLVIGLANDLDEVHTDLDDAAWAVVADIENADTVDGLRATSVIGGQVRVGGLDHPSYSLTLTTTVAYC